MRRNKPKKGEDLLVILLARGMSQMKAAKIAGVHFATVTEYMKAPAFRRRIDGVRNRLMDAAVGKLCAMSSLAMSTLEDLLRHHDPKIRIQAVKEWNRCQVDITNQYDLAKRIQELNEYSPAIATTGQAEDRPEGP